MHPRLQHLALERPLAFLDLETTGLDPHADRIVELALVKFAPADDPARFRHFGPDGAPVRLVHRLDPEVPIPPEATAVHRIADADVAGRPTFRAVARQVERFLEGCDLAGFNLRRFDLPLLAVEFAWAGVAFELRGRHVVDVLAIFHARERRDLPAAVRTYCGRAHAGSHEALADAWATAAVLDAMAGRYADLPRTPAGLHKQLVAVDVGGEFRRADGRVVFAAGKHRGRELDEVARRDPGYLRWLLRRGLLADAREWVERALARRAGGG